MRVGSRTKIWHPKKSVLLDASVGDNCTIHAPVWIGDRVVIGSRCRIQAFCFLPEGVILGDDVFLGPHVVFTNDKHPPSKTWLTTLVGHGTSIGANCTILPGIRIGSNSRIGAGTVVTRNVPDGALFYGQAGGIRG